VLRSNLSCHHGVSNRELYARPVSSIPDRYERGLDAYASQFGIPREEVPAWFAERFGERFAEEAINTAGGAWPAEDVLSLRDRSLIVLAALIVQGGVEPRLRSHVGWAVQHGATRAELDALVTLLAIYCGFPRASVGMEVVRAELDRLGAV
jgi:4-carboxymuconolactone decarboxylase